MLKNDKWIIEQAKKGMIEPFESSLIRQVKNRKVVSYGLSSYGYDIRLSPNDFQVFKRTPGEIVNPKEFDCQNLEKSELFSDNYGNYFIIPANSYALGVAVEKLVVPDNVTIVCIGKSTMARCGIIANVTPAEAGWRGHLTLEFSNSSSADCRIFANEGIVQLLFLEGEPCQTTYEQRRGKYQDSSNAINFAKV